MMRARAGEAVSRSGRHDQRRRPGQAPSAGQASVLSRNAPELVERLASHDGNEIVLNLVGTNEILGEISLLDGGARTADAVTATKCQLLTLDRRDFVGVLG